MKEQDYMSCFTEEYKKRYNVFTAVYQGVDAETASSDERAEKSLNS